MNTLKEEILQRYPIDILVELHDRFPSMHIDKEIGRRLANFETYKEVLPFIEKLKYSLVIVESLAKLKSNIPWRVGVIYDYKTGQIRMLEISVGYTGRYVYNAKPFKFTWLDCYDNQMMLREITNYPSYNKRISYENKDLSIIDSLLSLKDINITLGCYHCSSPSFILSLGENMEDFPLKLFTKEIEIPLINYDIPTYTIYNHPIKKSKSVSRLYDIFQKFNIL